MTPTQALRRTMSRATAADVLAGTAWYRTTHETASRLAIDYSVTVDTAARIIAVLSPRKRWSENVTAAETILRAFSAGNSFVPKVAGMFSANVVKAWRIANGDPSALSGPKVTRFYANIMGDDTEITLDVWAMRAAGETDIAPRNAEHYETVSKAYRTIAAEYGLSCSALQAVAWIVVRGSGE